MNSKKYSTNELSKIMMSSIERNKEHSEFDKLYKSLFGSLGSHDEYKSLHRFVRRSTESANLKPNDDKEVKQVVRSKKIQKTKSIFKDQVRSGIFAAPLQVSRDDSVKS